MANSRPGPDPKGTRKQHTVRFPAEQYSTYEQLAREAGMPLGDYIVLHMAMAHDLRIPPWLRRKDHGEQEELQLGA